AQGRCRRGPGRPRDPPGARGARAAARVRVDLGHRQHLPALLAWLLPPGGRRRGQASRGSEEGVLRSCSSSSSASRRRTAAPVSLPV
ncbi:MAG: hypothetical protein AVDCRST_MAG17-265, partial [uncultured Solirubrobacterales bacterium]